MVKDHSKQYSDFLKLLRELGMSIPSTIKSFENKLKLAQLKQYQNQFIFHEKVIDKIQHGINVLETGIARHTKKEEIVLDQILIKKHIEFRKRMEAQRRIYSVLKQEFFRFLSKHIQINKL